MEKEKKEGINPKLRTCLEAQVRVKKEAGKGRTASNYLSSWKKLETYLGERAEHFTLPDLSAEVARDFVSWMARGEEQGEKPLSQGTQDFYLRNLKTMYKKAAEEAGLSLHKRQPFDGLHIKVPPTRKRALPDLGIKNLTTLDLKDEPHIMSALHLALFLFYARGMCFIDVFNLEIKNLHDGYIHYIRSKTGVALQVKITPEMETIIALYHQPDKPWIFPFLHEKMQGNGEITPQSSLHRINDYLKKVGHRLGFPQPLTTYVMRHSWASMMLEADSGLGVISQSLGHTSLHTTEIYLGHLSSSKIDKAADSMLNNLIRPAKKKCGRQKKEKEAAEQETFEGKEHVFVSAPDTKTIGDKCKKLVSAWISKLRSK